MVILAILTFACTEVIGPTWLFSPLNIVIDLPLVKRVGRKLGVNALVFVVDQDCLGFVLTLGDGCDSRSRGVSAIGATACPYGGCGRRRSRAVVRAIDGTGGGLTVELKNTSEV